jgi:hypothetical protein
VHRLLIAINWSDAGLTPDNVTSIDKVTLMMYFWRGGASLPPLRNVTIHEMFTCWEEGTKVNAQDYANWRYNDSSEGPWWNGGQEGTDFNASWMNFTYVAFPGAYYNWSIDASVADKQFKGEWGACGGGGFMLRYIDGEHATGGWHNMDWSTGDSTTASQRPVFIIDFTPDSSAPTWSNIYNNASTVTKFNDHVNWTANISDNAALRRAWLEENATTMVSGKPVLNNQSPIEISGKNYNISKNITIEVRKEDNICGRFWFNDASNHIGVTDWSCFNVVTHLSECSDGIDNDNDLLIDDVDPGCYTSKGYNPRGNRETDTRPQCRDYFDNDYDGLTDYPADPECTNKRDNDEGV